MYNIIYKSYSVIVPIRISQESFKFYFDCLKDCLYSINENIEIQNCKKEVIIVDLGSSEYYSSKIKELSDSFGFIYIYKFYDIWNLACALSEGIKYSTGERLFFVNSDVILTDNYFLSHLKESLENNITQSYRNDVLDNSESYRNCFEYPRESCKLSYISIDRNYFDNNQLKFNSSYLANYYVFDDLFTQITVLNLEKKIIDLGVEHAQHDSYKFILENLNKSDLHSQIILKNQKIFIEKYNNLPTDYFLNIDRTNDLTVLIAVKDRTFNLKYCIESIKNNSYRPNVIIVDYGSEDPVRFDKYLDWVRVIHVNRKKLFFHKSRALNIGIKQICTKYVCVTDADQIFSENFFKIVYDKLSHDNNICVKCKTYKLHRIPELITVENVSSMYESLLLPLAKEHTNKLYGDGFCHGIDVEFLLQNNGFDEQFIGWGYEDSDMTYRSLKKKKGIDITHIVTAIHLPHKIDNTYTKNKFKEKNKLYFLKKKKLGLTTNNNKKWGLLN